MPYTFTRKETHWVVNFLQGDSHGEPPYYDSVICHTEAERDDAIAKVEQDYYTFLQNVEEITELELVREEDPYDE